MVRGRGEDEVGVKGGAAVGGRIRLERGSGDDAKVKASTTDAPKEIRVLSFRRCDYVPCAGHHLDREERVDDETVNASVGTGAAAEGGACEADTGICANSYNVALGPGRKK